MLALLANEFRLELRRKSVIAGIGLYLLSTCFICYLTFSLKQNQISPLVWSALFWITILFSAVNSIAKSFIGEKKGKDIYLYTIISPHTMIITKIIYNFILCTLLSLASMMLFILFFGNPLEETGLFVGVLLLAAYGFSASLTLISGIASRANNSSIIMAVLSFPVIISILLLVIKVTKNCIDGLEVSASQTDVLQLLAINCLVTASSYILFPYIWRT